ncbi:MAG: cytochrome-c peroxidase [Kangiellaceae bacterium]
MLTLNALRGSTMFSFSSQKFTNDNLKQLVFCKNLPVVSFISLILFTGCNSSELAQQENDNNPPTMDDQNDTDPEETTTLVDGTVVNSAALISLGDLIYHDTNLSEPIGQSCASCHGLDVGFDDPDTSNPTSVGADGISFGTRNSPTASYAAHIPEPQTVGRGGGQLVGGLFMDGRAATLEEQAKGPFLNPVEMGNLTEQDVVDKISQSSYANDFEALFGAGILQDTERSYNYIADAIAAFERTDIFSPFSSKFDRVQAGTDTFTAAEQRGQNLFRGKADCERCHEDNADIIVFSDFEYENIGVPSNPFLPALMDDPSFVDLGLGAETLDDQNNGQFRTPTLRNIAITAPYMHNGVFNTLEEVIDFYNNRDTTFTEPPEVNQNVDQGGNIGELNLTQNEISDLVAFLNTLTDQ